MGFTCHLERSMLRGIFGLILLALVLTGCRWESDTYCDPSCKMLPVKPDPETWVYQEEIIRIINTFATEIEFYHQINLESSYAIRGDDGLYYIWLYFSTQAIQDIPGARRLIVQMVEEVLQRLNENALVVGAQGGEDFTTDNLYLCLEYTSFYTRYDDPLMVARSELKYGYLDTFYAGTAFEVNPVIYHKHCEPYETSLLIVQTELATEKNLQTTGLSIYDRLTSPVDWMSGKPDYVRLPRDIFDADDFREKSTLSNYPRHGMQEPSGAIKTFNGKEPKKGEKPAPRDDSSAGEIPKETVMPRDISSWKLKPNL